METVCKNKRNYNCCFRNGGALIDYQKGRYYWLQIKTGNTLTYLCVVRNFNGIFSVTETHVSVLGKKDRVCFD